MLVAPLVSLHKVPVRKRRAPASRRTSWQRSSREHAPAGFTRQAALVTWLVCGILALLCIPSTRGGAMLGATLPFWLVGAPLLNLAWLERNAVVRTLRRWVQDFRVRVRVRRTSTLRVRSGDAMRRRVHQGI